MELELTVPLISLMGGAEESGLGCGRTLALLPSVSKSGTDQSFWFTMLL